MRTHLAILLSIVALAACTSSPFPVRDREAAIRIGKEVCRGKVDPGLLWNADLDTTGTSWAATTMQSVKKSGDHLWYVEIPVDGPYPTVCWDSLYDLRRN
jgi:hypothetical protein